MTMSKVAAYSSSNSSPRMPPLSSIIKAAFQQDPLLPTTTTLNLGLGHRSSQPELGVGLTGHRQLQKGLTQRLPPLASQQGLKERSLVYIEHNGIRDSKHILDFNSPRTKEAAVQLGLTFEDCLKR